MKSPLGSQYSALGKRAQRRGVFTWKIGLRFLLLSAFCLLPSVYGMAQGIVSIRSGASVPINCQPLSNSGLFYKNSGANIGLHECTAANTWTYRGALSFGGTLTPTALTGNVNDYSPTGFSSAFAIRINGGLSDRNITGLATGADGRLVLIINIGSTNTLTLKNEDSGSTAANRVLIGADLVLPINSSAFLRYDGTTARWRPVGQVLSNSGATAGSYGPSTITIGADGRITAASTTTNTALNTPTFCLDAGASDAYACSLSPAIVSYIPGTHYRFKANTANTGAASINFNALGAVTIVKVAGGITTALANNDIRAGQWIDVVYDGTNMQMQSTGGNVVITNTAGANVIPKSDGTNLVASQINDDGSTVNINTGGSFKTTNIGTGGSVNAVNLADAAGNVNILGALTVGILRPTATFEPSVAAGVPIGSISRPFPSVFVGNAINNSSEITGTFTGNRVTTLQNVTQTLVGRVASVALTGQTASITTTNLQVNGGVAPAGVYRVSGYIVVTTAGADGTLSLTIGWNDGTAARTATNGTFGVPADIAKTATNILPFSVNLRADGTNNITYAVTLSTANGTYAIYANVERLQ